MPRPSSSCCWSGCSSPPARASRPSRARAAAAPAAPRRRSPRQRPTLRVVLGRGAARGRRTSSAVPGSARSSRCWREDDTGRLVPVAAPRRIAGRATADGLFARGLDNLRSGEPAADPRAHGRRWPRRRVQITRFADNYTAARLLLPELWSKIAADARRPPLTPRRRRATSSSGRRAPPRTTSVALRGQARTAYREPLLSDLAGDPALDGRGWTLDDANPTEL